LNKGITYAIFNALGNFPWTLALYSNFIRCCCGKDKRVLSIRSVRATI